MNKEKKDGWISIEGPFSAKEIRLLKKHKRIEKLSLTKQSVITAKIAKAFESLQSVHWLWLWCSVTRTAMRHVTKIPDLEVLDILEIKHPGSLTNFAEAKSLKEFRCNHYMTEADLLEISNLPVLKELGAHSSAITNRSLEALLDKQTLEHLDIECSEFDDEMAIMVSVLPPMQ